MDGTNYDHVATEWLLNGLYRSGFVVEGVFVHGRRHVCLHTLGSHIGQTDSQDGNIQGISIKTKYDWKGISLSLKVARSQVLEDVTDEIWG